MQLSQLYRRGVIRPLDDEAARQLEAFRVDGPIRAEWLPILNDDHFAAIWKTGILQRINDACQLEIDDHEEEELNHSQIDLAIDIMQVNRNSTDLATSFFRNLEKLLADARATSVNVYFIF